MGARYGEGASARSDGAVGIEALAAAVAGGASWADVMRRLGVRPSGGRRRSLQRQVAAHGIDARHLTAPRARHTYSDEAITQAVASSTALHEVACELGARPAPGTLSHLRRRIDAAGIDISHFPAMARHGPDLPCDRASLARAATGVSSVRALARALGWPDDGRSRAALRRLLVRWDIDVAHFRPTRMPRPDQRLTEAVAHSTSYAAVVRALGLAPNDASTRRVQRWSAQLGLDTSHFTRASRRAGTRPRPTAGATDVLRVRPADAPRVNRARLHRALEALGVPARCAFCGNEGEWRGASITLHIDHVSGDWRDNRPENLRYLCPNCHATTDTWCRNRRGAPDAADAR
ncbi:HNH endonuclease [Streptomyces sp. NPDC057702]|uniref:HNH endonuclease signature motif containing protein n=1 Tax=unclassified Streptomyces TaxID=2593676 RepID=UPI00367F9F5A